MISCCQTKHSMTSCHGNSFFGFLIHDRIEKMKNLIEGLQNCLRQLLLKTGEFHQLLGTFPQQKLLCIVLRGPRQRLLIHSQSAFGSSKIDYRHLLPHNRRSMPDNISCFWPQIRRTSSSCAIPQTLQHQTRCRINQYYNGTEVTNG